MSSFTGSENVVAIRNNDRVNLLPIFIKNMIRALDMKQQQFLAEARLGISDHFLVAKDQLKELEERLIVVEIETKGHIPARNQIRKLLELSQKISNPDGVRRLTVLNELESLIEALNNFPEVGNWGKEKLRKIIEMDELFDSSYNSGMEDRTFSRLLSVKDKPLTDVDKKTEIIIETFVKKMKEEKRRRFLFQECLTPESIDVIFFKYKDRKVVCCDTNQAGNIVIELLKLKSSTEAEWYSILYGIVRSLVLKPYGFLGDSFEEIGHKSHTKNIFEANEHDQEISDGNTMLEETFFAEFNVHAIRYISSGVYLTAFVPQNGQLSPQNMLSVISDAFGVLVKLHRENKINIAEELDTKLAHELILHSLHNQKGIHASLCGAFKSLCRGK